MSLPTQSHTAERLFFQWVTRKRANHSWENLVFTFVLANALNGPPEEYGRKTKTQRNRRGLTQVVEHVV